jgi:hypothetical protein
MKGVNLMTKPIQNETRASHTPGPWNYDMDFIVGPDPTGLFPDIYIAEIAHADDEGRIAAPQQQDANRRLIAAAPDLLRSLESVLEYAELGAEHLDTIADSKNTDLSAGHAWIVIDEARAAIAKAASHDCDWR